MKNKPYFIFIMVFCLLFSIPADAEEQRGLRLWDVNVKSSFWKTHPEITQEEVWLDPHVNLPEWIETAQPDMMKIHLYNDAIQPLMDADLMADLSGIPAVAQAVSRMMPWVQDVVTDEDGNIRALPTSALLRAFYWYPDAWNAAGLTMADVPQSYTELLSFLDRWAEDPAKGVCASHLLRWNTGTEKYNYMYWLVDLLMLSHEMQQRYAGETVRFSKPQFVELAERARSTGIALYEAEPRQDKRSDLMQLFQNDTHGGEHGNGGRDYGLSHSVPLRLTSDQPALHWLSMQVVFIRNGSPLFQESRLVLEHLLQPDTMSDSWWSFCALYADFKAGDYAYDNVRTGHISQGWLDDYRNYEGAFVAYPISFNAMIDAANAKESIMMQFFSGELSAEEFAMELDALLHIADSESIDK